MAFWAGAGLGISAAVVAPCGTATPDWVLLLATSEGDGVGETGVAAGCSGVGVTAACC